MFNGCFKEPDYIFLLSGKNGADVPRVLWRLLFTPGLPPGRKTDLWIWSRARHKHPGQSDREYVTFGEKVDKKQKLSTHTHTHTHTHTLIYNLSFWRANSPFDCLFMDSFVILLMLSGDLKSPAVMCFLYFLLRCFSNDAPVTPPWPDSTIHHGKETWCTTSEVDYLCTRLLNPQQNDIGDVTSDNRDEQVGQF